MSLREAAAASSAVSPGAAAPLFAALGDATRLALVARLGDGRAWSIRQLTHGLDLSRQGVSKHLRVLEQARVVTHARVGRESLYTLELTRINEARAYLEHVRAQWHDAVARLRSFVEER